MLVVQSRKQIITLKYQTLRKIILPLLIIINLQNKNTLCKNKKKKIVDQYDISNLVKNSNSNTKFGTLATKAEVAAEQNKIVELVKIVKLNC